MEATIKKWGNSYALRIPKEIVKDLKMKEGYKAELKIEDGKLLIEKKKEEIKPADIEKVFFGYKGKGKEVEEDWSKDVGKEDF
jgi:antitoxin MazE